MDFLKLVQKKEHKTDNKIIVATVFLVVFIMSAIVFWPSKPRHSLLSYLPDNTSFYVHWINKKDLGEVIFVEDISKERIKELEDVLGSNFLNLQEVLWFETDNNSSNDNYLLKFSRLPKSFLFNLENKNLDFEVYSPDKNILLINRGTHINELKSEPDKISYFEEGVTIYFQKDNKPKFLDALADVLDQVVVGNDVLLNWQKMPKGKNRFILLENRPSGIKDIRGFLSLREFDYVFGFNSGIPEDLSEEITNSLLKTFFNSLPYYNLSSQAIKDRILKDSIIWQKGDGWILASDVSWQDSILDFLDNLNLKEVAGVLSDGTAYIELVASEEQNALEQQINGQKVLQIDNLFIWDIGDKHYLTNKRELIEELSSSNYYLANVIYNCLGDKDLRVGDIMYFNRKDAPEGELKAFLEDNNIDGLNIFSYATSTISGLNLCF